MWFFWIIGAYLFMGGVCVFHDVRTQFKDNLKKLDKYKYHDETDVDHYRKRPRRVRSYEEQTHAAFDDSWHSWGWTFILWPLYIVLSLLGPVIDGIEWLLAGKEIRKARELDEEKKTKELLARFEAEEKKKFEGL